MCGIVGVVDFQGRPVERELVEEMNARIVHRGPDEDGFWFGDGAGLAMRRLSIIDLAGGTQPFFNEDGSVLTVFNGELYNFKDVQRSLRAKGHVIQSNCDTEILPHLYDEYGCDLMKHLVGMFAIAIWDRNRRSLLLARDRLGIKPLHYAVKDGRFYFASELKSLECCGVCDELSSEAIYHYLTYGYIPAPLTIYQNVFKLPQGHYIEVVDGRVHVAKYWDVNFAPGPPRGEQELLDELHEKLTEAVRIRLVADVPLGAFLSGGVDSSLVVALMAKTSTTRVKTFSISFEDAAHDESAHARAVAERFGTDHTELTVHQDLWPSAESIVLNFDEPFADSSAIPTYFLSKLTREHVTVAMSGDGGDELFGGYDRYLEFFRKRSLYRIPRSLRRGTFGLLSDLLPRGTRGKRFLRSLRNDALSDYVDSKAELDHAELLSRDFMGSVTGVYPTQPARHVLDRPAACELDTLCMHDIALYLPDDILTKVDRTSMAVSLEVRVPILDHRVVEFAATLPADMRLRGGVGKYALKKLLERYLPAEQVHRRKHGFSVPLGQWFRGAARDELLDIVGPSQVRASGVFNPDAVRFLIDQHMSGRRNHKSILWRLFVYHLWDRNRVGTRRSQLAIRSQARVPVQSKN